MNLFTAFRSDQRGAAAIQYALVAGVLSVVVLAGSLAMRGSIIDLYDAVAVQATDALLVEPAAGPQPEEAGSLPDQRGRSANPPRSPSARGGRDRG